MQCCRLSRWDYCFRSTMISYELYLVGEECLRYLSEMTPQKYEWYAIYHFISFRENRMPCVVDIQTRKSKKIEKSKSLWLKLCNSAARNGTFSLREASEVKTTGVWHRPPKVAKRFYLESNRSSCVIQKNEIPSKLIHQFLETWPIYNASSPLKTTWWLHSVSSLANRTWK